MRTGAGQALEIRQRVQSDIDFARGAAELVAPNVFQEFTRQLVFINELDKGKARVDAGGNYVAVNFITILQNYALSAVVLDNDLCDGRFRTDFRSMLACRIGNRIG